MDDGMYATEDTFEENYYEEWYGDIDTYWTGQDDWVHRDMLDEEVAEQLLEEESAYDEQMQQLYINYKEARDQLNQARRGRGFWPVVAIPTSDGRASLAAVPPEPPRPPGKGGPPPPMKGKGSGKKGSPKGKGKSKGSGKPYQKFPYGGGKKGAGKDNPLKRRLQETTRCRACGQVGHWEADCPNKGGGDAEEPPLKFRRPPSVHFADGGGGVGAWNWMNFADAPAKQLEQWVAEEMPAMNLMTVTDSMPEGTAIVDCGAALDCMGDSAAAKTAQAIMASGETRLPEIVDKEQTFKFGGDGGPKKADFAVIFPVTIGETPTWIEAFVIEGNTPHLVSRRWLSKHKCIVCS